MSRSRRSRPHSWEKIINTATPTEVNRKAVSGMPMKLFDHWHLSTEEQLDAIGLSPNNQAVLTKYRRGEPLTSSRDTRERACHLLAIHENLRLLFPYNRDLAYVWLKTRNKAFEGLTPIETRSTSLGLPAYSWCGRILIVLTQINQCARVPHNFRPHRRQQLLCFLRTGLQPQARRQAGHCPFQQ